MRKKIKFWSSLLLISVFFKVLGEVAFSFYLPNDMLYRAVKNDYYYSGKIALYMGADPNFLIGNGETLLTAAVLYADDVNLFRLLINQGSDFKKKNKSGFNPLEFACNDKKRQQFIDVLIELHKYTKEQAITECKITKEIVTKSEEDAMKRYKENRNSETLLFLNVIAP